MAAAAKKINSKSVTLSLKERITISSILPMEGEYNFFIIKKDILKKTAVTQEELKKYDIKTVNQNGMDMLSWNAKGEKEKFNIEFTDLEKNEIKLALTKLSDGKKLTEHMVSLYELFVK